MNLGHSPSVQHSSTNRDDSDSPSYSPVLTDEAGQTLPLHNENRRSVQRIGTNGESGRRGFHPIQFAKLCFRSTTPASAILNVLWPVVPAAIAVHFARPDLHVVIFTLNYIAMVPSANLLGFAGSELARKCTPRTGALLEAAFLSMVEVVLFMVLLHMDKHGNYIHIIQDAILGSILANLLLCLGLCLFFGGMRRDEQVFHDVISETGSGLLLVAGFALLVPSAFYSALKGSTSPNGPFTMERLSRDALLVSRGTSVVLLCALLL